MLNECLVVVRNRSSDVLDLEILNVSKNADVENVTETVRISIHSKIICANILMGLT